VQPQLITFTGADDHTNRVDMAKLSLTYPVEWGILFSPKRQGVDPRYPNEATVRHLLGGGLPLAAHLCGKHSGDAMKGLIPGVSVELCDFARVQINSRKPRGDRIAAFQSKLGVPCIAQARGDTFPVSKEIQWLFDTSGGRGEAPTGWPEYPGCMVGYAGGINPDNVLEVIEAIDATGPYWIDMESGVRTDDLFDLNKCAKVCELVYGVR